MSRAAGADRPRGTTLALVVASNLPDIDIVLQLRSGADYLLFHRGITHSLLGLLLLPAALAVGLWWAYRRRTPLRWLALVSACGVGLHLVYDVVTPWGTMLLYPWSADRFALDWLFIVDFTTWALPISAIVLSALRPRRARAIIVLWLVALGVYGTGAGLVHRASLARVRAAERDARRPVAEAFVFPRLGAPLRWNGIVASPGESAEPRVGIYRVTGLPPAATAVERVDRGFDDPRVAAALATRSGQAYLWWARVPVAETRDVDDFVEVTMRDLRYSRTILPTAETWTPFAIRFRFDRDSGQLIEVRW